MYPDFEEFQKIVSVGEYRRVPVCRELYADCYTPVEVMRILKQVSRHCYLLESAEDNQRLGRYSFLGYDPVLEITCTDGELRIRNIARTESNGEEMNGNNPDIGSGDRTDFGKDCGISSGASSDVSASENSNESSGASSDVSSGKNSCISYDEHFEMNFDAVGCERGKDGSRKHPGEAIRRILAEYYSPVLKGMPPFTGGLVGYFSYDYIKYAEPSLQGKESEERDFKDVDLMLFDKVIVFDHYRQKLLLITGVPVPGLDSRQKESRKPDKTKESLEKPEIEALQEACQAAYRAADEELTAMADLLENGRKTRIQPLKLFEKLTPRFTEAKYCEMVEKARHYIREGDIFQVVLSNPVTAAAEGSLFDTYRELRTTNPSPYMFYFSSDDIEIAGASPETLVKLKDGVLHTFPLAGTRPRGGTEEEDRELERELLHDEKELAEHNMLVDLGRNDLGRISRLGSVQVEKYLSVQRFSHVMHLGSTVSGVIREDRDAVDAVDAILPAGTLSGAPKIRACEIIRELEGCKRGIYGGAVGYLDFTGNLDTCIAIRLAYKKDGRVCVQSGAGIVADSIPEKEYQECLNKAQAVMNALYTSEGGLNDNTYR